MAPRLLRSPDMRLPPWLVVLALGCGKVLGVEPVTLRDADVAVDGAPEAGADAADAGDAAATDGETTDVDAAPPVDPCEPDAPTGVVGATYGATVLADAPLGYWPLDEPPGAGEAADASGRGHPAVAFGTIHFGEPGALARKGAAAARTEGFSYLSVGRSFDVGPNESFTVEAWIKPAQLDDLYRFAWGNERVEPPSKRQGIHLYLRSTETNYIRMHNGAPEGNAGTGPLILDRFHHVVVRYDGPARTSSLVIDGKLAAENADFGPSDVTSSAPFTFGATGAVGGSPFEGTLDELAIYDHVVPCSRLRAHLAAAKLP